MSEQSKAWVWSQYEGIISQDTSEPAKTMLSGSAAGDRVVPIRPIKEESYNSGNNSMTINRAKYGILIAVSVLSGLFFPLVAVLLLVVAGLLIASGREPQKTEEFLAPIPGGNYVVGLLAQFDDLMS